MPNLNRDILIANIKKLMEARGVNQPKLSADLNIAQSSISKLLSGKQNISLDHIYSIAQYFDVTIDSLCNEEKTPDASAPAMSSQQKRVSAVETVCTALATIYKLAAVSTSAYQVREVVYTEELDDEYRETGYYGRKYDQFQMDPANTYTSIYFSNYYKIADSFSSIDERDDYMSELHCCGNCITQNVTLNTFINRLTDILNVYKKGSLDQEAYTAAIDSALSVILKEINE